MRAIRRHIGAILTVCALVSLALGTIGFLACDPSSGFATAFYRAIQLFYWNYFPWNTTLEAKIPWTLEVARWLAPLVTLGALSRVALSLFQKHWDSLRARRLREHVIICGAGEKGATLAADLRKSGTRVVLIEQDARHSETLGWPGLTVLNGDATRPELLRQAGAAAASRVVAATGDDHRNLALAMLAAEMGAASVHAHSSDAALCDLYQRHSAPGSSGRAQVRVFNRFRNVARCAISDFPPDAPEGDCHVVLPASGPMSLALVLECALIGQFAGDRRLHLHTVGEDASRQLQTLQARYPGLPHCIKLSAMDLPSPHLYSRAVTSLIESQPGKFTVFPDLESESLAFPRALELLESRRSSSPLQLVIPGSKDSAVRSLALRNPVLSNHIGFLPFPERTCGWEAVVGESLDRVAKAIHENWLKETRLQIAAARTAGNEALASSHEKKATFKPWEKLSEEQKGANRSQADHIPFKIRAAGLDPKTATKTAWEKLPDQQVERLARMEHARWAAYYWMTGWTFAADRNDTRKEHPNLVPYDDLNEPTKGYDRLAVRNVAQYLDAFTS